MLEPCYLSEHPPWFDQDLASHFSSANSAGKESDIWGIRKCDLQWKSVILKVSHSPNFPGAEGYSKSPFLVEKTDRNWSKPSQFDQSRPGSGYTPWFGWLSFARGGWVMLLTMAMRLIVTIAVIWASLIRDKFSKSELPQR